MHLFVSVIEKMHPEHGVAQSSLGSGYQSFLSGLASGAKRTVTEEVGADVF